MAKKSKIGLIYTGGTIAMRESMDGRLMPPEDPKDFLKIAPELKHFWKLNSFLF
jgi:L-asparaginase/Glu-tRNA(Gln) amidotransferase subunit D